MSLLPQDSNGCPFLLLAPMEGVGDKSFRQTMASVGGFDEAVRDFLRVPKYAHVKSLASVYDPGEIAPYPLAAQIMGSDLDLIAEMGRELARLGAKRIDLNCGCPSNTVTGRGAGSSLLKDPEFLHQVAKALVESVPLPVTIKMRSGFQDTSLFQENLHAAESSGIAYLTIHPRTKEEGYGPPARWELIAQAKSYLKIPVVGNGDISTPEDARRMLKQTGCDALMIGRGCLANPFLFHQIRADFAGRLFCPSWQQMEQYVRTFTSLLPSSMPAKTKINKCKQLWGYFLKGEKTADLRQQLLTVKSSDTAEFCALALELIKKAYPIKYDQEKPRPF